MEITLKKQGTTAIIRLEGRLDTTTSPLLSEWLEQQFYPPSGRAVLDLTDINYLSSAGLRVLLGMIKKMRSHDFLFSLCCPHQHLRELLEISGFTALIPVHTNLEDCLT